MNASNATYQLVIVSFVVVFLVIIEPHLGQSDAVLFHYVHARLPRVGTTLAEYVADMGTGHDLQRSSAHPYLQGTNMVET